MMSAKPRLLGNRTLGLAAASSVIAIAALAFSSGASLVDRSFETAFAAAGQTPVAGVGGDTIVSQAPADLWLTGHAGSPPAASNLQSRIGERITMAVDGGPPVELEVIAVSELATPLAAAGSASPRLVMVTCRETGRDTGARTVRLILDGDEPLPGASPSGPARTL